MKQGADKIRRVRAWEMPMKSDRLAEDFAWSRLAERREAENGGKKTVAHDKAWI
jgi:hypothetical protein